ncbi:IclR family transcriptional regulator C-terminal domain-containing protein [Streptomyces sp. NPDC056160]|uniref:IclR family transcriptional regulator domain-containing protein n=1 Tax=Streptomyces sp. NPDC056160 TaxID=3345731 RepID=UPI0035E00E59
MNGTPGGNSEGNGDARGRSAALGRGEALLVERLSARDATPVRYRVGGRLPLASTGVGLVLLAFAPGAVQEQAIAAYAPGHGDDDIRTPDDLRRVLAEVRRGEHAAGRQDRPWRVTTGVFEVERCKVGGR